MIESAPELVQDYLNGDYIITNTISINGENNEKSS